MPIRSGSYGYLKGPGPIPHNNKLAFRDVFKSPPKMPSSLFLTKWMPDAYDQGAEGSCVYNSKARMDQYSSFRSGGPNIMFSRQFGYWCGRKEQGTLTQDSGDFIHSAYHVGRFYGIIPESEWAYIPPTNGNPGNMFTEPPQSCFDDATKDQQHFYAEIQDGDIEAMKMCIAHSFPFQDGFQVPDTFEDPNWDFILDTSCLTGNFVGGHSTVKVGYDDNFKTKDGPGAFLVYNSWGQDWGVPDPTRGVKGLFWVSYKFIQNTQVENDIWMERFLNQSQSLT